MKSRTAIGKNGVKMGTRIPRNLEDWKEDFQKHYSVQQRKYETPCWIWGNISSEKTYGQTKLNKIPIPAHRLSWILHRGKIPVGLWVLHKCDERHCVNPDHLFLGTAQDNTDDMRSKKRARHINANPNTSLLTVQDVLKIREILCNPDEKIEDIAKKFSVAVTTISAISEGITWKHVGPVIWTRRKTKKITDEQVLEIKSMLRSGEIQSDIANKFGITQGQVSRIKSGERG